MLSEIIEKLKGNQFFETYRFAKSKNKLIKEREGITYALYLEKFFDVNESNEIGYTIRPYFGIRINAISKFLEKFYLGNIMDIRDGETFLGFPHDSLGINSLFPTYPDEYFFQNGRTDNTLFYEMIKEKAIPYLSCCSDIRKLYIYETSGILEDRIVFGGGGFWIFEQLLFVQMMEPNNYEKFKNYLKSYQRKLYEKNEPNALDYYPYFDLISKEIENSNWPEMRGI